MKQNNFMRIDELPYHSSLFYKLNFVSRRQFFINIGKYPSKMQKVRNDPFLGNKIFKRRALFSDYWRFLWRLVLWLEHSYVFRSSSTKSPFCPTSETPSGRIQCYVWFPLFTFSNKTKIVDNFKNMTCIQKWDEKVLLMLLFCGQKNANHTRINVKITTAQQKSHYQIWTWSRTMES